MKKKYIMVVSLLAFIALVVGLTCYIVNDYNYKIEKNKIAVAKEKVELAKNTKNTDDINEAKKLIGEVDTEEVKEELTIFISNLEEDIEKENIKNEFMDLLDTIEKEYNESSLNEVIQKLESIKYDDVKNSLLEKCNSVREKINAEKERITEKENFIDIDMDNLSTELESINTEIQSIKSLIDDAISSVFDWGSG